MSPVLWLVVWGVVIATIVVFLVRERRRGAQQPAELDRFQHEAVREAQMNLDARGPNSGGQGFMGG